MLQKLHRWGQHAPAVLPLLLVLILLAPSVALAQGRGPGGEKPTPTGPTALIVQDLTGALTPQDLAGSLAGVGVAISNVTYVGAEVAAGAFNGGTDIVGFESGVILSSGAATSVIGPNTVFDVTKQNFWPGDPDLDALSNFNTFDAAILEFDFVASSSTLFFHYVFSSDEYNEYVHDQYNDVFAFYINGVNCAFVGANQLPVSVNTINNGFPYGIDPVNPELYRNNDPFHSPEPATIDTEMDGLTEVLNCGANVTPGATNHMKLAIADATDDIYYSNVFIAGLTTEPTGVTLSRTVSGASSGPVALAWIVAALLTALALALLLQRRANT
jgi:hypothetical protein